MKQGAAFKQEAAPGRDQAEGSGRSAGALVVTRLFGGLGNQMFQYALGRRLALAHGARLKLDLGGFAIHPGREFGLAPLAIHAAVATSKDLSAFPAASRRAGLGGLIRFLRRGRPGRVVRERTFTFDPDVLEVEPPVLLEGYWQSDKYFADIGDTIRRDFTPREPLTGSSADLARRLQSVNSISLHIRRGDYVTNPVASQAHGLCSVEYYGRAVATIAERVSDPEFFVFTDEPGWAREHLRLTFPVTFVEHNLGQRDYEDLHLMSMCHQHILANSSFSWWGAWLNPRQEKIVVAPAKWFSGLQADTSDLLPDSWIRI